MRLTGKVALITGAGTGIGRATVLRFLREGAQVAAGVYEPGHLESLVAAAGDYSQALLVGCADVTRPEQVRRLIADAVERFGGLDILVNNAGIVRSGTVTETSEADWDRVLEVNLKGLFWCSKYAIPHLEARGAGAIVNVSSINGIRGNHRMVAYAASKGGVVAATMAMALDYAKRKIRVNCVCPATIADTPMVAQAVAESGDPEQFWRYLLDKHPLGRFGRADEVAAAILFLASDDASFITGVALPVDGGRSIR